MTLPDCAINPRNSARDGRKYTAIPVASKQKNRVANVLAIKPCSDLDTPPVGPRETSKKTAYTTIISAVIITIAVAIVPVLDADGANVGGDVEFMLCVLPGFWVILPAEQITNLRYCVATYIQKNETT